VKDIFKTDKGKYVAPAPIELELSKKHVYRTSVCSRCKLAANYGIGGTFCRWLKMKIKKK
jgi:hypothetical protein